MATVRASKAAPASSARPRLTPERIIEVAGEIVDKEGVAALTMRRLAQELGVAATAIYWHVRTRDDLLRGVLEKFIDQVEVPEVAAVGWEDGVRILCRSLSTVLSHPHIVELSQQVPSEAGFRLFHRMVDILINAGFKTRDAVDSAWLLQTFVYGLATAQSRMATIERDDNMKLSPESLANWFRVSGTDGAALLDYYLTIDHKKLFDRGIEDHIAGLSRLLDGEGTARPARRLRKGAGSA